MGTRRDRLTNQDHLGLGQHGLVVTAVTGSLSDQLVRGDAVGDEHIHPASEKGAAQCGQLADATGDRDPARDRHQLLRPDSDHFLVELGFDEGARFVEEPETDVPDGAETPQHLLVGFGDCVAALGQERGRFQGADAYQSCGQF